MRDPLAVENARQALGEQLAAYRQAAGYSQVGLAKLVTYSRSTVANVETGRQRVPAAFWERSDSALSANGALIDANEKVEALARRDRRQAAHKAGPALIELAQNGDGGQIVRGSGAAGPANGATDLVALAAAQARDHAEKVAVSEIGPGTLDQLKADIVRLGQGYVGGPPLPLFAAMHRELGRVEAAADQRTYPHQARDLNFLAGALCGLMANASLDLGHPDAADDLARAAWTYGATIDHGPLMGWARGTQALAAIWDDRFSDGVGYAEDGLSHLPAGKGAARLHAIRARAFSAQGDYSQARAAITAAEMALAEANADELHDGIAGEFAFGEAKLLYYRALTLVAAGDPDGAEAAAEASIRLYEAAPVRARSYGCEALARVQLARARLMTKKVDDAVRTLREMLRLDPAMRISSLNGQLDACRTLLYSLSSRTSGDARVLEQELADFTAASAVKGLYRDGDAAAQVNATRR